MKKYRAHISYLGTSFCGWQRQDPETEAANPSIQGTLEEALRSMTQESVSVVGSGRTDAGVHATGQVAHFRLETERFEGWKLKEGLNSYLPAAIRIVSVEEVSMEFHAQRGAVKKQYSFYFQQGPCALPQLKSISWWIKKPLDIAAMNEAVQMLRGEHDFVVFQAAGSAELKSTVRTIFEASVVHQEIQFPVAPEFHLVRLRLVGSGFLKQMVRAIAGTLVEIGEGRRPASDMRLLLETKDRAGVGVTAAPQGLFLEHVWY